MHFVARPSNSAFRLLIVLALVTSMPTTALLAQVPDESVVHFWTAARTTGSPCAGARRATPTMPMVR